MDKKEAPREPVEYRVKEKSLVGNEIHEAGAVVKYAGLPAENLEPMCEEGEARYQEYLASNKARVKAMQEQFSESAVGDPAAFMKALAEDRAAQAEAAAADRVAQAEGMASAIAAGIAAGIAQALAAMQPVAGPADVVKDAAKGAAAKGDGKDGAKGKDSLV